MEPVIGMLKNLANDFMKDESMSPLTKQIMFAQFEEAVQILTYNRYSEDILVKEILDLRALLAVNEIEVDNRNLQMAINIQPHLYLKLKEITENVTNGPTVE